MSQNKRNDVISNSLRCITMMFLKKYGSLRLWMFHQWSNALKPIDFR